MPTQYACICTYTGLETRYKFPANSTLGMVPGMQLIITLRQFEFLSEQITLFTNLKSDDVEVNWKKNVDT